MIKWKILAYLVVLSMLVAFFKLLPALLKGIRELYYLNFSPTSKIMGKVVSKFKYDTSNGSGYLYTLNYSIYNKTFQTTINISDIVGSGESIGSDSIELIVSIKQPGIVKIKGDNSNILIGLMYSFGLILLLILIITFSRKLLFVSNTNDEKWKEN